MSTITVRKGSGGPVATVPAREWDPVHAMRDLFRWDPFREMVPVWTPEESAGEFMPSFEVKETKEAFVFKADVPGVKESDIEVTLAGNRLAISGKREAEKQDKTDTYFTYERSYGSFTRAFTLPEGVEGERVRAELKDGVLTLLVPKRPEVQPKKISVKVAEKMAS
jgi:HSP20 family protein